MRFLIVLVSVLGIACFACTAKKEPSIQKLEPVVILGSGVWVGTLSKVSEGWTKNGDGWIGVTCGDVSLIVTIVGWPGKTSPTKIQFAQNSKCKYLQDLLKKKVVVIGKWREPWDSKVVAENLIEVDGN